MDSWAVLERRPNHVNKRVVADIWFWQFLEPWHERWYEYVIFIASCTDNIYDLENERWLLGDMIDHVGIYRSRVAEGLSASNVGLVLCYNFNFLFCGNEMQWHLQSNRAHLTKAYELVIQIFIKIHFAFSKKNDYLIR